MKVIILAAGKGSRIAGLTAGKPKCLLKLGNETILEREIRILNECGISKDDIFVVGGYKYQELQQVTDNIIVNDCYDTKDNSYSLALALKAVQDDVLIMDSDLCFDKELVQEILNDSHQNILMSKCSSDLEESTGIVCDNDMRVSAIGKQYMNTGYVYISIFKICKEIIPDLIKELLTESSEKTWYPLAITKLCEKYQFYNLTTVQRWHEIDFEEDYRETLKMFEIGVSK